MNVSLDALRVLDAIDRRGSFAAAAEELGRVASAVTYTVRRLEDTLDVLLFDRRGHRARLTPAGRELLDSGRRLLAAAAEIEARVHRVATGWEAELRIAVDTLLPLDRVWPLAAGFYADCRQGLGAHTRLRITQEVLGGTWDALAEGRADLVLAAPGDPPPGGGYRLRALAEVAALFVVAPGHPLAGAPEPLSEAVIGTQRAVVAADSSRRLPPRTVGLLAGQDTLVVPDLPAKIAAQIAGLGCGYVPAHLAAAHIAAGRLVVKRTESARPPGRASAAWRETRPGKALAWWIDAVSRADWSFLALSPQAAAPPSRRAPRTRQARRD